MDYRTTSGILVRYSISTKHSFLYDLSAKPFHRSRDVVFREPRQYSAPSEADGEIMNEHFYRDVLKEPKPTGKEPSERQTEESLYDESPLKPKKMLRELAGLETFLRDAWKPPAEGSHRNRADQNK